MNISEVRAKFPEYKDVPDIELVKGIHQKFYSDIPYRQFMNTIDFSEKLDPTKDMTGFQKFAAGAGKAVYDLGLGARQIGASVADYVSPRSQSRAAEIQKEVDEVKARDAALMNTGAGMAGNIAGNIATSILPGLGAVGAGKAIGQTALTAGGKMLLASPATLGGAAVQSGMGAAQAALQPVATGESRLGNAAIGGIGGALVPVLGMGFKGAKAAVEPLYEGGRQQILARALRASAGENADIVAQRMRGAAELVPGSAPTAAEVANSGGIAAMQRAASAVDPESYATRAAQQNEARVASLRELAGSGGEREFYAAARESAADALYKDAYKAGIDLTVDATTGQTLSKAQQAGRFGEINKLMNTPALKSAADEARNMMANDPNLKGQILSASGSVQGLHYTRKALSDMVQAAIPGSDNKRILTSLLNRFDTTLDTISPSYAQARITYREMSKPINQMDIAQELANKSISPLNDLMQPNAYARNLSDNMASRATGFKGSTLSNTMTPEQLQKLNAIKSDLARSVAARDLGRGAGSDTTQKLSMTNLLQQSGIPVGVINTPGLGRVANFLYSGTDERMREALAKALLNPKSTAELMEKGIPNKKAAQIAEILRMFSAPAVTSTAVSLQDAR